jgi:hypothetical protein
LCPAFFSTGWLVRHGSRVSGHASAILSFWCTQLMEPFEDGRIGYVGVFDCCPPKPKNAMQ